MRVAPFHAAVAALLALLGGSPPANAKVSVSHVTAGGWMSTDFHDPQNPGCSVGIDSSVPGSRMVMGANRRRSDPVTLLLKRDQWRINPGTTLQAVAQFPNDRRIELTGTGDKQNFTIDLTGDKFSNWIRALKHNKIMQITLGGQEPTWLFDIEGAPTILNAMIECLEGHQIANIPAGLIDPDTQSARNQPVTPSDTPSLPQPVQTPAPVSAAAAALPPIPATPAASNTASADSSDQQVIVGWNGAQDMQTRPFHAGGSWEMQWTSGEGHFSIVLHDANGGRDKLLVNTMTPGSSSYFVPQGGDFFAEISASSNWSVRAVSLKPQIASVSASSAASPAAPVLEPEASPPAAPSTSTASLASQIDGMGNVSVSSVDKQNALLAAVDAARRQYADGQNDMAKGAARAARKQALCQILTAGNVVNWNGKVSELTTNGEGKGVISIEIGPHTQLKTWNNSLSDISDQTLIDPESALFQQAVKLHTGQNVRFSAKLFPSGVDCVEEGSLTLAGSISDPEFIMRLVNIESVP